VSRLIQGKTSLPSDMAPITAAASADSISIMGESVTDPDIEGYELRMGTGWTGAILMGFYKSPMIRFSGVKPGTYTWWIAPMDNRGQYSSTKRSAQCTVYYPPSYTDKNTWSWNFSTGTFSNTERTTYGGEYVLRCSHTDNVLTGTWTSPEYDLGSIKTVRVWGDFETVFEASDLTWGGILPSGTTWEDIGIETKRWYEIFASTNAGQLRATLRWGDTSGSLSNEASFFELLAPEITGRYVQVVVTITDPTIDSVLYLYTLNMKAAYWS
jgi:hypothetical protein